MEVSLGKTLQSQMDENVSYDCDMIEINVESSIEHQSINQTNQRIKEK